MALNFKLGDDGAIHFGADNEIKLSHVNNTGLTLLHTNSTDNNGAVKLTLQNNETAIDSGNIIGSLNFQTPNESDDGNARLIVAGIEAVAQADFTNAFNGAKLSFKLANNGNSTEKMSLDKEGILTLNQGGKLKFVVGSNNLTIQAPTSTNGDLSFTLPSTDGDTGQFLKTDGTGALSWGSASGSSGGRTITTANASVNTGVIKGDTGTISGNNIIVNIVVRITTAITGLPEFSSLSLDIGTTLDGNDLVDAGFLSSSLTADTISASSSGTHSNSFSLSSDKGYISGANLYFKVYSSSSITSGAMKFYVETIPA